MKAHFPYSFLLLVSLAINYVPVYAVERRQCHAVSTLSRSRLWDLYHQNKKHLLSVPTELTRAKNDFGTIHRTPLAPPSCFTAQFASIAKRVAVAMDHRFSATAPNAQRSLSNSVSITDCSNVLLLWGNGQKGQRRSFGGKR